MNEITKAIIEVGKTLPKLKLNSYSTNHVEFVTYNCFSNLNEAIMNIKKENIDSYFSFPMDVTLRFQISKSVYENVDWIMVDVSLNSYNKNTNGESE